MNYDQIVEGKFPRTPSADMLAKAEQAGFDVSKLWYHGTRRRFDDFKLPVTNTPRIEELGPGVYVTAKKWLANTWARERGFVLTCVVRKGPLFNLATTKNPAPETFNILLGGYAKYQNEHWPHPDGKRMEITLDDFMYDWKISRDHKRLVNLSLAGAGYIGGYDRDSQIEAQIVVFEPEDVMIMARFGGESHMSQFD
jgi:hypothetical protein